MTKMMAALMVGAAITAGCGGDEQTQTASPSSSPTAAQKVEVSAIDFAFDGVPETLEAGLTTFVLTNEGEVSHEMTVGLLPPGWTIEEVALGSSDSGTKVVGVIGPIEPGASEEVTIDLEPGRYGYICHESEGTKGKAHFFRGMLGEFKVE